MDVRGTYLHPDNSDSLAGFRCEWAGLEDDLELDDRAAVEDIAVIVGVPGGAGQVVVELAGGLGDVDGPEHVVAGLDAGILHQAHVQEEAQLVEVAEEGLAAVTGETLKSDSQPNQTR